MPGGPVASRPRTLPPRATRPVAHRSGSMMGEVVEGGGRGQAGRDESSSCWGTASEHRHPSNSHRRPHYSPDGLVGGRSLERRDDPGPASARHSSCRNAVRDPCGRGGAIHWRSLDPARQSGTVPGWPSCRRKVGFRPESLGRVSAATLRMSGRYSGCRWDQVLVPHVRRLPHSRSAPVPAPQRARSALPNPGQA